MWIFNTNEMCKFDRASRSFNFRGALLFTLLCITLLALSGCFRDSGSSSSSSNDSNGGSNGGTGSGSGAHPSPDLNRDLSWNDSLPLGITLTVSRDDSCYDFELKTSAPFEETTETERVCDSDMDSKEFGYRVDFRTVSSEATSCDEDQISIRFRFGESDGNGGLKTDAQPPKFLCFDLDLDFGEAEGEWSCGIDTIVSGVLDRLVCTKGDGDDEITRRFDLFEADETKAAERLLCDISGLDNESWPTDGSLETDVGEIDRIVYESHLYDTDEGVEGENQYKWVRLGINGGDEQPRLYSKDNAATAFLYAQGVGVVRAYGEDIDDTEGFFVGRVTENSEGEEIFDVVFIDMAALQSDGIDDEDDVDADEPGIYGIVLLGVEDQEQCTFTQPTSD